MCHDEGSVYDAAATHALTGLPTVSGVAFTAAGLDLVVTFNLKVDGVNATDFDSITVRNGDQTAYRFDGTDREQLVATLAGGADGNYSITVPGGATNAATNSRYMFRVANPAGTRAIVLGDSPAAPVVDAVSNQACNNCHGETGIFQIHGGGYAVPAGMEQCTVCHKSTAYTFEDPWVGIIHGVHNSHGMPSGHYEYDPEHIFSVTYPTYMTNCSVCHDDSSKLAAANSMTVSGANCFTCHESMESWEEGFVELGVEWHLGYGEGTDCSVCHDGEIAPATVTGFHNGLVTERGGIIWDGADTSVVEGAKFTWTITDVVDNGTTLAISWEATYDGAAVDPCNATVGPGAPVFDGDDAGNLSILYTYFQGEDPILGTANAPGQASAINTSTTNTTCAAGVATTTVTPARVAGATRARIALQGKPRVVNIDPSATAPMAVRAKTPVYDFVVGTGDPATPRRELVDTTGKCLDCHVGSLYQHGGNRVDNIEMCILCHNSASSEQNVRVGMGVDATEAYDGKVGQTFEMKTMLHAIHSAGDAQRGGDVNQASIVIYRNRGIYAWAISRDLLPNWPGEGAQIVYGSNDVTQNHNFHNPTFPRLENDCGACHVDDFGVIPDQTKAMATTLGAGVDPWTNQIDDELQGAGAAACTSCHSDAAAKGHAYQNGWTPQVFPNGRQTIIDAAN